MKFIGPIEYSAGWVRSTVVIWRSWRPTIFIALSTELSSWLVGVTFFTSEYRNEVELHALCFSLFVRWEHERRYFD